LGAAINLWKVVILAFSFHCCQLELHIINIQAIIHLVQLDLFFCNFGRLQPAFYFRSTVALLGNMFSTLNRLQNVSSLATSVCLTLLAAISVTSWMTIPTVKPGDIQINQFLV
jgi:hypothetical protein